MTPWTLVVSHLVAVSAGVVETEAPAAPVGEVAPALEDEVRFLDGGVERLLRRHEPARAAGRTRATFLDPATGRSAEVTVGLEAIVLGSAAQLDALVRHDVVRVRTLMPSRGIELVRSARSTEDGAALAARLAALVRSGALEEAYPDLAFRKRPLAVDVPPDDPRYVNQYYFDDVRVEEAWAYSTGDPSVLTIVNDNGCDLEHPDLVDKLEAGFDPFDGDDDPTWLPGGGAEHGTACAGLVAADTDNGRDIAGACPECRVACVRVLPPDGVPSAVSYDVDAFQFAFASGAAVVSNSWGFVDQIPVPAPLAEAIIDVQQYGRGGQGAAVIFAVGNDSWEVGDDELVAVEGVIGVGALNNLGELTTFTNFGNAVDVVAVTGTLTLDISGPEGADPGDVTSLFGGTSSACPVVAGIAGLIASAAPDLTGDEINEALIATAKQSHLAEPDENGHDPYFGFGMVQADHALERALGLEPAEGEGEGEGDEPPGGCAHDARASGVPAGVLALLALGRLVRRRC